MMVTGNDIISAPFNSAYQILCIIRIGGKWWEIEAVWGNNGIDYEQFNEVLQFLVRSDKAFSFDFILRYFSIGMIATSGLPARSTIYSSALMDTSFMSCPIFW
jgi:hypothetical protein